MKNSVLILILVAVITSLGLYTLSQGSTQSDSMMIKDVAMTPKKEEAMEPTVAMMQKDDNAKEGDKMMDDKKTSSRYVQYSKSALDDSSNTRRVLFFFASWCPTCKPADANFTQNVSKIPDDVTLIRVNYNDPETDQEEKDLEKKYGITYQHTFVQIDSTGKEVTKWNGGQISELITKIK